MEITGPEPLRIVVDPDQGMQRRCFAPLAECFAIDIAPGAGERPAVLFGQNLRLFLEDHDAHDASLYSFLKARLESSKSSVTATGIPYSPFGACACSAVRSAVRKEKRNENPNAGFFGSGTCAWRAARGFSAVRCSRRPGRQSRGKGRRQESRRDRPVD